MADAVWPCAGDPTAPGAELNAGLNARPSNPIPSSRFCRGAALRAAGAAPAGGPVRRQPLPDRAGAEDPGDVRRFLADGPDAAVAAELAALRAEAAAETDTTRLMQAFRLAKRRTALLIALADIGGVVDAGAVTAALTDLADAASTCGRAPAGPRGGARAAAPRGGGGAGRGPRLHRARHGQARRRELNYSSDIDLIVFYDPDAGACAAGRTRARPSSCG